MVVLGGSRDLVNAALERADGGDSLSEDDFETSLDGLPDDSLARVYVDVQGLLGDGSDAAAARKIPWVDALRTLGLTLPATGQGGRHRLQPAHRGRRLSDAELPLAAGDEPAEVVQRPGEIGVGLRDPSQLISFFESAFQAVDPQQLRRLRDGQAGALGRLDLDVDKDVFAQLTGNLSVSASIDGQFGARAEVKDPAAFEATVDKVAKALPELLGARRRGDQARRPLRGAPLGRQHVRVRGGRRRVRGGHRRRTRPRAGRG